MSPVSGWLGRRTEFVWTWTVGLSRLDRMNPRNGQASGDTGTVMRFTMLFGANPKGFDPTRLEIESEMTSVFSSFFYKQVNEISHPINYQISGMKVLNILPAEAALENGQWIKAVIPL